MPVLEESRVVGATLDPAEPETQRAIEYATAGQRAAGSDVGAAALARRRPRKPSTTTRAHASATAKPVTRPEKLPPSSRSLRDSSTQEEAEVRQVIHAAQEVGITPHSQIRHAQLEPLMTHSSVSRDELVEAFADERILRFAYAVEQNAKCARQPKGSQR